MNNNDRDEIIYFVDVFLKESLPDMIVELRWNKCDIRVWDNWNKRIEKAINPLKPDYTDITSLDLLRGYLVDLFTKNLGISPLIERQKEIWVLVTEILEQKVKDNFFEDMAYGYDQGSDYSYFPWEGFKITSYEMSLGLSEQAKKKEIDENTLKNAEKYYKKYALYLQQLRVGSQNKYLREFEDFLVYINLKDRMVEKPTNEFIAKSNLLTIFTPVIADQTVNKFSNKCKCKCSEHPEQDLIKEDYTGHGYCPSCDHYNLESDINPCDYCTGRYDQFMELLGQDKLK